MARRPTEPSPSPTRLESGTGGAERAGTPRSTLAEALDRRTVVGALSRREGERIRCVACGHRCLLAPGRRGVCRVRFHDGRELRVPFGYTAGIACDPVEKKPFFHVHPGSDALTFGMLGCDLHCAYCQNWFTSQALRDEAATATVQGVSAEQIVAAARRAGARLVVSSYNEPLITAEWAAAVFERAKPAGLLCAFVSNGNATPEALDYLQPWLEACKVDLKSFNDRAYRRLGGTLAAVTDTIQALLARGVWVEVVTLLVPGFNDEPAELRALTGFLASVSRDLPWHVTAFHPDYRLTGPRRTGVDELRRAAEIGAEAGLRFVYAGNLPGRVGAWEDTRCAACGETVVARTGFTVQRYALEADGTCPKCRQPVPGRWPTTGAAAISPASHAAGSPLSRRRA